MGRPIEYIFHSNTAPNELKTIKERGSVIKALSFTAPRINEMSKVEEQANNYALYFLFGDECPGTQTKVYVGQSRQGIARIVQHRGKKDFWTRCMMFVSVDHSFDANTIDYLEYHFIHRFRELEHYQLANTELREREPVISPSDLTTYTKYIDQIEFLLRAEGIRFDQPKDNSRRKSKKLKQAKQPKQTEAQAAPSKKYYPWVSKQGQALLYYEDGRYWIEVGATLPPLSAKTSQIKLLAQAQQKRKELLQSKQLETTPNGGYRSLCPIPFNTPSAAAGFLIGRSANGWSSFVGLEELRPAKEMPSSEAQAVPDRKYYPWISKQGQANLYYEDGLYWIEAGATLPPPSAKIKPSKDLDIVIQLRKDLLQNKQLEITPDGGYLSLAPIPFKSPSTAARFLFARSANGWVSFVGIEELRRAKDGTASK